MGLGSAYFLGSTRQFLFKNVLLLRPWLGHWLHLIFPVLLSHMSTYVNTPWWLGCFFVCFFSSLYWTCIYSRDFCRQQQNIYPWLAVIDFRSLKTYVSYYLTSPNSCWASVTVTSWKMFDALRNIRRSELLHMSFAWTFWECVVCRGDVFWVFCVQVLLILSY